jgi:hypothetical protein
MLTLFLLQIRPTFRQVDPSVVLNVDKNICLASQLLGAPKRSALGGGPDGQDRLPFHLFQIKKVISF